MKTLLKTIYGEKDGNLAFEKIQSLVQNFPLKQQKTQEYFSERDVVLITYGDSIKNRAGKTALKSLHEFCKEELKGVVSTVHILPFFPFSSDDGFSVIDFYEVDENLGCWKDIKELKEDFSLMFDFVLNHISSKSKWFEQYLSGKGDFAKLAIAVDPALDLSMVTRPRSLPLLTKYTKKNGENVHVWTTFSDDQIDINYASVEILIKFIEVILYYVRMGAEILRLDAIAYLWKEFGTSCIHLPNTHNIVKLFRMILDEVAPNVMIITETNVPHEENISYFGDGNDEAQMVYNFTLPPLLLYSFIEEDVTRFNQWAKSLTIESEKNTFFNFTASHDGIGVRPLEGILPKQELDKIIFRVKRNGGRVSYKQNSDGSESPYELNITYVDAYKLDDGPVLHANRFLASQSIQLVLPGVPGIYIHSILGSHNWEEGVQQTERARTINREKLFFEDIKEQLSDPSSFRSLVFAQYKKMIAVRKKQSAFHPNAGFEILEIGPAVFCIKRISGKQLIIALTNVTSQSTKLDLSQHFKEGNELLSGKMVSASACYLEPYQVCWIEVKK